MIQPSYDGTSISLPIDMFAVALAEKNAGKPIMSILANDPEIGDLAALLHGALTIQGAVADPFDKWMVDVNWAEIAAAGAIVHQDCVKHFNEAQERTGFLAYVQERLREQAAQRQVA